MPQSNAKQRQLMKAKGLSTNQIDIRLEIDLKQQITRAKEVLAYELAMPIPHTARVEQYQKQLAALEAKLPNRTVVLKEGKQKFVVSAAQDRSMGQSLFDLLAPPSVTLHRNAALLRGESRLPDESRVVTSNKGRWIDDVVALERAKHAPTLPVVNQMLGRQMGEVWKAIEEASAAYRQTNWTHNPKVLSESKKWVARRPVNDVNTALTNAAYGLEVPPLSDSDRTTIEASPGVYVEAEAQNWIHKNASLIQAAVEQATTLEELWDAAYWIGQELNYVSQDPVEEPGDEPEGGDSDDGAGSDKSDSSDSGGCDFGNDATGTEGNADPKGQAESEGDGEGSQDDQPSNQEGGSGSDADGFATEGQVSQSQGQSPERGGGADLSDGRGQPKSQKEQVLDALLDSVEAQNKPNPSATAEDGKLEPVHAEEDWVEVKGATHPVERTFSVQLMLDEFAGQDEVKDAYFGEAQTDILHEIRIGNLEVFEEDAPTQGDVVVAVDCSGSMQCWCTTSGTPNGWLAWQVAAAIHSQFPEATVFGYSSGGSRSSYGHTVTATALTDSQLEAKSKSVATEQGLWPARRWTNGNGRAIIVPVPTGHRPACHEHGNVMGGGTPESGALVYLAHALESKFENAVGILITDGQPSRPERSYAMTRQMAAAGMRFGVIQINNSDTGIYPASILHQINGKDDLFKLADIFQFISS